VFIISIWQLFPASSFEGLPQSTFYSLRRVSNISYPAVSKAFFRPASISCCLLSFQAWWRSSSSIIFGYRASFPLSPSQAIFIILPAYFSFKNMWFWVACFCCFAIIIISSSRKFHSPRLLYQTVLLIAHTLS